ncbi:hypothetical protein D3C76_593370 [compost metagenome]
MQQFGRIERRVVLLRQAFEAPGALLVFAQDQLQASQLNTGQAYFAGGQAGPEVRHQLDVVQTQRGRALAKLQVAHAQHRGEPTPAPLKRTDMHRQAQRLLGLEFEVGTVFGDQRYQLPTEADVERHQYRQQRAEAQAPAGQDDQNAGQTSHGQGPPGRLSMMAGSTGFASPTRHCASASLRGAPHRTVPANTSTRPGSEWFDQ